MVRCVCCRAAEAGLEHGARGGASEADGAGESASALILLRLGLQYQTYSFLNSRPSKHWYTCWCLKLILRRVGTWSVA